MLPERSPFTASARKAQPPGGMGRSTTPAPPNDIILQRLCRQSKLSPVALLFPVRGLGDPGPPLPPLAGAGT